MISYHNLLDTIIKLHFPNHKFSLKGSLEWRPISEKQKDLYFKKFGKELKIQRKRYNIKEVYWEDKIQDDNVGTRGPFGTSHHHIVISNIEEDGIFYVMNDYKVGRMGQTFRYKFQIIDYQKNTDLSNYELKLINNKMILIR